MVGGRTRKTLLSYLRLPAASNEIPWNSMKFNDAQWNVMEFHGHLWNFMDIYAIPWIAIEFHGYLWNCVNAMSTHG